MSNFSEHSDVIEIITRCLSNEADDKEITFIENWRKESNENESLYQEYQKLWNKTHLASVIVDLDVEHEWQKFGDEIEKTAIKHVEQQTKVFSIRPLLRIAASIVVIFSLTFFGWYLTQNMGAEKYLAQNEVKVIELPDGSKVTLNHTSKLKFDKTFGEENREVTLEGEAFFEVAKDSAKPFVINASGSVIEVLGTSFNVNAYRNNSEVEVVVNTGLVALSSKKAPDEKVILKPGEKGELLKENQKLNLEKNEDINFLSWKTRKLVFENTSLIEVIESLERVYHKNFEIQSENIKECTITTTLDNQELESVMLILESTLDVRFEKGGEVISVSGSGC